MQTMIKKAMLNKAAPVVGLGLVMSVSSHAAMVNWQDSMPSAIKPFADNAAQLAQLVDNDIMVYSHPAQSLNVPSKKGILHYNNARFSSAAIIVPAKPEQVKQLLAQYSGYAGLFPTLTKATVLEQSGNMTQMKYRIHVPVPIPILNFNEDVVMQHQVNANSIQTLILDSPIQYGMGKFEWFPVDSTHTLVTLTQWGDLDKPKGFLVSTILKAIPEVKQGIPQSVDTFVLETLKRKFDPDGKLPTQGPRQLPYKKLQQNEIQLIQQLNARSGSPVMFIHRPVNMPYSNRAEALQFVSTYATLRAPAARSTQVLGSPANFKNMFSQVSKVEVKPLGNQASEAAVTVKVGLGVIAIPFKINLRYYNEPNNKLYYQANGGDIEYMQGQMQFSPLPGAQSSQQTFLSMTSAGKIGDNAPFLLKIGKSLPYSELLPTVGGAPVFIYKANQYLSKTQPS